MPAMEVASGVTGLEKLTRRHAVKFSPPASVSVEECVLAVGEIVGHGSVKSTSRMNNAVVVFVDSTDKADELVVAGVAVNGELTPSPLLRHVVSFRRQVSMILNNNKEELDMALRFRVDEFDYTVFVITDSLKCFGCGEAGHVIRSCPNGAEARRPADPPSAQRHARTTWTVSPRR
ncbi:Transposon TX1 uncharacterized 82 kDa protein ORF 1, partial [Takifugu flavidus]